MRKLIVALTVVSVVICAAAYATEKDQNAAKELVMLLAPKKTFLDAFCLVFKPQLTLMKKQGIPQYRIDRIEAASIRFANNIANDPEFEKQQIALYRDTFTEKELQELLKFYQTPLGRKTLKALPGMMKKGAAIAQTVARKHQPKYEREIQAILTDNSEI